jgi:hypothetical protein
MSSNLSAAQTQIKLTLLNLLNQIPVDPAGNSQGSPLIGPLDPDKKLLRMPKAHADGRKVTWTKTINNMCGKS